MRIAEQGFLLLLWLIPALAAFYVWSFRRREELLAKFARAEMFSRLLPPISRPRQRLKAALLSTAVVFALLALIRPQWGFHWEEITREGVDIMVAVDVSQSMMAQDVKPNRLSRARQELQDLLQKLEGDRVGLIAFAGTAFIQCPLTLDYGAFRMFLDYLDPELIPVQGTNLAEAIRTAQEGFNEQASTSKALILITDGESHDDDALDAAKKAKEAGIKIFTIGIGAAEGAPIPAPDGQGFLKDENGDMAMTRLDEETLKRIAVETGGAYVAATTGDMDLERIYTEGIRESLEAAELSSTRQKRWEERFQWPLAVAVLLIIVEALVSERGRRRAARAGLVLLLAAGLPSSAQAGLLGDSTIKAGIQAYQQGDFETALQKFTDAQIEHPDDPLLDYNLGNTYYKTKRFAEAEASFQKVVNRSPDPKLRQRALYNLGNTAYRQGKLEDAVKHYEEALKLDPDDKDAQFNLERTRKEIQRRIEQNKQQQQQRQQQQQQQQQQQGDDSQGGQGQPPPEQQGSPQAQKEQSGKGAQEQQAQQGQGGQQPEQQQAQQDKQAQQGKQAGKEQQPKGEQGEQAQAGADPAQGKQAQTGQKEQDAAAEAQAAQAGQKQDGKEGQGQAAAGKEGAQGDAQGQALKPGQLSKEEALRILNQVKDEQGAAMRRQGQRRGPSSRPPGGKPW